MAERKEYKCDGCGRTESVLPNDGGRWPTFWRCHECGGHMLRTQLKNQRCMDIRRYRQKKRRVEG